MTRVAVAGAGRIHRQQHDLVVQPIAARVRVVDPQRDARDDGAGPAAAAVSGYDAVNLTRHERMRARAFLRARAAAGAASALRAAVDGGAGGVGAASAILARLQAAVGGVALVARSAARAVCEASAALMLRPAMDRDRQFRQVIASLKTVTMALDLCARGRGSARSSPIAQADHAAPASAAPLIDEDTAAWCMAGAGDLAAGAVEQLRAECRAVCDDEAACAWCAEPLPAARGPGRLCDAAGVRFLFAGAIKDGLLSVLRAWPRIHGEVPGAQLLVCAPDWSEVDDSRARDGVRYLMAQVWRQCWHLIACAGGGRVVAFGLLCALESRVCCMCACFTASAHACRPV